MSRRRPLSPTALLPRLAVVLVLTFAGLTGCAEEPADSELEREAEATAEQLGETADVARQELIERIQRLEDEAAELQERSDQIGAEAREEWTESVAQLEAEAHRLRAEMAALGDKGEEAWQDFSARARESLDELEQGLNEAAEELN